MSVSQAASGRAAQTQQQLSRALDAKVEADVANSNAQHELEALHIEQEAAVVEHVAAVEEAKQAAGEHEAAQEVLVANTAIEAMQRETVSAIEDRVSISDRALALAGHTHTQAEQQYDTAASYLEPMHGRASNTAHDDQLQCGDGTLCYGWSCCRDKGGRERCPPNLPNMCAQENACDEGTTFCCEPASCARAFDCPVQGCINRHLQQRA